MRRKFILIEQSLRDVGGHYFEYAREILYAAEAAGYEPVLATHRDFRGADHLPSRWRVLPLFPFTSDKIHRIPSAYSFGLWRQIMASGGNLPAIASRVADAVSDRCKAAVSRLRWWRRLSRVRGFATACEQLIEQSPLAAGDQVLCSTVSDMDLLGLVRFLRNHPDSAEATWHLQFHFSVYCGRDPDYPAQDRRTSALRRRIADAIASLPRHRLFFYTTTDELGRQFNRLDVAGFETLPWPVGEQFRAAGGPRRAPTSAPLRVLCAGAVRREKGSDRLGSLAQSLWNDLLKPRKVQLLFQIGQKRRWQALTELPAGTFESATNIEKLPDAPLVSLPHPLQPEEYARLIQSADIGLLLYNADVYFARCSGILAELLAVGVPVIVPAGGWLAEQFAEENYRHLDELAARASYNQSIPSPQAILCVPPGSSDVVIRLRRADSDQPGSYLRIACEQFDAARQSLGRAAEIVGHRGAGLAAPVSALFHLAPGCASVHVAVSSAYHKSPPVIERAKAAFLAASATAEGHWPAGRVGRSFADPAEIPRLLAELVSQHAHYHAGAQAFALRWAEQHAAQRTMEEIAFRSASPKLPRTHAA